MLRSGNRRFKNSETLLGIETYALAKALAVAIGASKTLKPF